MAKKKSNRVECYEVLASRRHPETGQRMPAVRVGFTHARSSEEAVKNLTNDKEWPLGTTFGAFLGDPQSAREWAAEARVS